ncbi:MAG: cyclase family protein [Gaiellales bacterium]|nr:MAG: cyclase family protein [Gaiellales bacterium]
MARFIDISVPIHTGMTYYPGDAAVKVEPGKQISSGDVANLSVINMGSHTGTHVDAPHHFIDGEGTVDRLSLDALIGAVRVLDLGDVKGNITRDDLVAAGAEGAERVILKTSNSELWARDDFERGYVFLTDGGADYLVEQGVKLVGNDYLSIEEYHSETHYVHGTLLRAGIIILEGVDLGKVEPGDYQLVCLPLRIKDGDGAPARAILMEG